MEPKMRILHHFAHLLEIRDIGQASKHLFKNLDVLMYLHEAISQGNVKLKENEIFLESLIMKFYLHGITLCKIADGYKITSNYLNSKMIAQNEIFDISSLFTVGRAQLETFLMYHHIYINSEDENVQNLRYYCWIYSALLQNLNFQQGKVPAPIVEMTKHQIEIFKNRILNCPALDQLTEKQQKSIILNGDGKTFKKWSQIFSECNFANKTVIEHMYYLFSVYAHSEGLSGIQIKQNGYFKTKGLNQDYTAMQLCTAWMITGAMINNLVIRFPSLKNEYERLDDSIKIEIEALTNLLYIKD